MEKFPGTLKTTLTYTQYFNFFEKTSKLPFFFYRGLQKTDGILDNNLNVS